MNIEPLIKYDSTGACIIVLLQLAAIGDMKENCYLQGMHPQRWRDEKFFTDAVVEGISALMKVKLHLRSNFFIQGAMPYIWHETIELKP